jgi:serine/threonine protein kinase
MYECLTGHAPFQAPSMVALIARVLTTAPMPPMLANPDVPPALSELVMGLLAKTPDARPRSASLLVERLAELG